MRCLRRDRLLGRFTRLRWTCARSASSAAAGASSSSVLRLPLLERLQSKGARVSLQMPDHARTRAAGHVLHAGVTRLSRALGATQRATRQRHAVLGPPTPWWLSCVLGTWSRGASVVALSPSSPPPALAHCLVDASPHVMLVHPEQRRLAHKAAALAGEQGVPVRVVVVPEEDNVGHEQVPAWMEEVEEDVAQLPALIIYTSGTTGPPKGVVHTHGSLEAQMRGMSEAWAWTQNDDLLQFLPLHHIHGIVNVVMTALWNGAHVRMLPTGFDASLVWKLLRDLSGQLSMFMGVPTVYSKLVTQWESTSDEERAQCRAACQRLRVMISGSAALPDSLWHRWKHVSDHELLERYGMSEIGMALGNPLQGPRIPGSVGKPFPGVEVKTVAHDDDADKSDLWVRGGQLFQGYWNNPKATAAEFDDQGWFRTGDVVTLDATTNTYRICGRSSVDIIKTGGFKISALDVERTLLEHPHVSECVVFGVPDDEYGQKVVALMVATSKDGREGADAMRAWSLEHLPRYAVPRRFVWMNTLPRNAMGKVNKKQLAQQWVQEGAQVDG